MRRDRIAPNQVRQALNSLGAPIDAGLIANEPHRIVNFFQLETVLGGFPALNPDLFPMLTIGIAPPNSQ